MKLYTLILLFLLNSCSYFNSNINNKLIGLWQIDSFKKNDLNYVDSLYINTLIFKETSIGLSVVLPKTENFESEYAYAKLNKKENILSIESINPNFRGVYKVVFFKNYEKKLLGIKLESDKNEIIAYKAQQDFEFDGISW
jgi:hypothetical protein